MNKVTVRLKRHGTHIKVDVTGNNVSLSHSYYIGGVFHIETIDIDHILQSKLRFESSNDVDLSVYFPRVRLVGDNNIEVVKDSWTYTGDRNHCLSIHRYIQDGLKGLTRPRSLLVLVNPMGGSGKAAKLYREVGEPIFDLCGIQTDVIETRHSKHAECIISEYDLNTIDGIICAGGDGFLNQIISALLKRSSQESESDKPQTTRTPIGIIPCGSGNAIGTKVNGLCRNIETACINIVLGFKTKADVMKVVNCGQFLGYGILTVMYGLLSDVQLDVESTRWWAGPYRYHFFLPLLLWRWRTYDVRVEYCIDTFDKARKARRSNNMSSDASSTEVVDSSWHTFEGAVSDVGLVLLRLRNFLTWFKKPRFVEPQLSASKMILTISKKSSFVEMLKGYKEFCTTGGDTNVPACVEQQEVTQVKLSRISGGTCDDLYVNIDGEIVKLNELLLDIIIVPEVAEIYRMSDFLVKTCISELSL